jgi:hypothetical protein
MSNATLLALLPRSWCMRCEADPRCQRAGQCRFVITTADTVHARSKQLDWRQRHTPGEPRSTRALAPGRRPGCTTASIGRCPSCGAAFGPASISCSENTPPIPSATRMPTSPWWTVTPPRPMSSTVNSVRMPVLDVADTYRKLAGHELHRDGLVYVLNIVDAYRGRALSCGSMWARTFRWSCGPRCL